MLKNNTIIIVFILFASLFLFELTKKQFKKRNKALSCIVKLQNIEKENEKIYTENSYITKPNQDYLTRALTFASKPQKDIDKLTGFCNKKEYTYETLDEQRRRILKLYINLALAELNKKCVEYSKNQFELKKNNYSPNTKVDPFYFVFIEIINATSAIDKNGNSRWRVDIMVEETRLHISSRLILDFIVEIYPYVNKNGDNKILTCAEYTTFPFPKYFIGYPTFDQMIPLPTQVISTGPGLILSQRGKQADYPNFKSIILNKVSMENSDLALGTELPSVIHCSGAPGAVNDTNLPSSEFPSTKLNRNNIHFPEKIYADYLEKNKKSTNTDIYNNYRWKPPNYNKTGHPENKYHYTGNSETFKKSMIKPNWPSGWIQPAKWRNKWPRLWSEPRDRYEYPSVPVGYMWNNLGVRYPIPEPNSKNPGIRWSTQQTPRTPLYWPTITGLPLNGGPNYWLFNKTRGVVSNLPHGSSR